MIDHGLDIVIGKSSQAEQTGMIAVFDSQLGFFQCLIGFSANGFRSHDEVIKVASTFASEVKSTPPRAGYNEVFMPGEIEEARLLQAQTKGVNLSEEIVAELLKTASSVRIVLKQ